MGVHSKLFTATDAITHEPFTMLIEVIDPIDGEPFVVIKALEGEYRTREAFQDARQYSIQGLEKGCSDTAFLMAKNISIVYTEKECLNPDLMEVNERVYLLQE